MKERTKQVFKKFLTGNTYLTFEDLSKEYQLSERTLRNELILINDFLAENNYPIIRTKRGKGMKLSLPNKECEKLLDHVNGEKAKDYYRPDERFLSLILDIADNSKTTLLYEMEEKLQVSKSTMDEDMRKLRQFIKKYALNVVSLTKQGVVFQGDERSIRSMVFEVMNSMIDIDHLMGFKGSSPNKSYIERLALDYVDHRVLSILGKHYDKELKKSNVEINHLYRNQILLFLAIWIRRIQEGCTVSELTRVRSVLEEGPVREFVDIICDTFSIFPSLNEIKYITFTIESFNPKDMNNSFDWVTAQLLAIQLIEHVEKVTGIPFSHEEEDLYEGLYKHITGLLSRGKNEIKVFNPLKDTIKESYETIFRAIASFSKQIENYTKIRLSEDEIGFLTIYFSTSKSRMNKEEHYVYQAVVVCNHGISTGKLLAANLKEQFNIEIVAVLSSYELSFIEKLDVDLIFTSIPIDYQKKPILLLNPILKEMDKKEIKAFLKSNIDKRRIVSNELDATKLLQDILALIVGSGGSVTKESYQNVEDTFKKHNLKFNKREIQPMLQDILKDTNILLKQECTDWEEVITKAALPLLNEKVIEENYINAMIKSVQEFGPYIVIGKHLALAHARPEDGVNKLGVSVMTLREPVHFGNIDNDPVKIVFCLAAVDSYSHLNIMKSLIELINDDEKIDKLNEAMEVSSFKEMLYEN